MDENEGEALRARFFSGDMTDPVGIEAYHLFYGDVTGGRLPLKAAWSADGAVIAGYRRRAEASLAQKSGPARSAVPVTAPTQAHAQPPRPAQPAPRNALILDARRSPIVEPGDRDGLSRLIGLLIVIGLAAWVLHGMAGH